MAVRLDGGSYDEVSFLLSWQLGDEFEFSSQAGNWFSFSLGTKFHGENSQPNKLCIYFKF